MTDDVRSDDTRTSRPSAGQWAIAALVVLALVASLIMVFGDDMSMTATIAVICALWAAVIGAVLVTKYRRQADTAETRSRDMRLVYELQLEREIAARRQYESEVESTIREEVAAETGHELTELKAQVLSLRASLEELLGRPLPESQIAIGLERPRELGSGLAGASYVAAPDDRAVADQDFAATAPAVDDGRHVPTGHDDVAATEMTEIIPVVTDDPEPQPAAAYEPAPRIPTPPPVPPVPQRPYAAAAYEPPSAPFRAQRPEPEPEAEVEDDGAHVAGRPASELLSRLRESAGGNTPSGGHRRRRD